jgi:hypothetical protein
MYDASLVVAITLKITSNARSKHGKVVVKRREGSGETPGILAQQVAGGANLAYGGPWRFGTKAFDFGGAFRGREYLMRRVDPPHPTAAPAVEPHETGPARTTRYGAKKGERMKRLIGIGAVVSLALLLAPAVNAQNGELLQGTQLRLVLLNGLSTSVARAGDPFTAVVAEPVVMGTDLVLPAGAKVHGVVGSIERPKRFSIFRGQAAMNLQFKTLEIEGREFPAPMSILGIYSDGENAKARKDLHTTEGAVIQERRDVKADVLAASIGTGGGSLVGAIFSHVVRGLAIGMIGSTAYIIEKKGKEVELPAQTGFKVRLDKSVSLPSAVGRSGAYTRER